MEWQQHLHPLDGNDAGWSCAARIEHLLAGEPVVDVAAGIERDVCDDGHVHTDVTLGLVTPTRLVHVMAGDAQHVTDEHELGLQLDVAVAPLTAITDVAVRCWGANDDAVTEVIVSRAGAGWQAFGELHDCVDPACEIGPGSIRLEARTEAMTLLATGDAAEELMRFAGQLSRVSGPRTTGD